jgi:hypothetical protein
MEFAFQFAKSRQESLGVEIAADGIESPPSQLLRRFQHLVETDGGRMCR